MEITLPENAGECNKFTPRLQIMRGENRTTRRESRYQNRGQELPGASDDTKADKAETA